MSVHTGAHVYSEWDFESAFGGGDATKTKVFGMDEKITSIVTQNNQMALPQLNSVEVAAFAYGQEFKRLSVDWVLSNPWWLELLLNGRATAGAGPFTHTYTVLKVVKSFALELGFEGGTANVVRTLDGSVLNSVTMRSGMNELVRCSGEVICGKEAAIGTSLDATPPTDDIAFPYTFVHGTIKLPASGSVVAELQSMELTMNQNAELVYGHGSKVATGAFRKLWEVTGRFNASMVDAVQLQRVLDRAELADIELKFTNGLAGTAERTITITGTGVGVSEQSYSAAGVEPVFEDLIWQIRSLTAVATNNTSLPP